MWTTPIITSISTDHHILQTHHGLDINKRCTRTWYYTYLRFGLFRDVCIDLRALFSFQYCSLRLKPFFCSTTQVLFLGSLALSVSQWFRPANSHRRALRIRSTPVGYPTRALAHDVDTRLHSTVDRRRDIEVMFTLRQPTKRVGLIP